jgi:hypothetical protein
MLVSEYIAAGRNMYNDQGKGSGTNSHGDGENLVAA